MTSLVDQLDRPLGAVRISVTDRCNLRCRYCMPEDEYSWLPRAALLSFEEITRLVRVFAQAGVDKFRLTGGEPLLRRDLDQCIAMIKPVSGVREVALTTNGLLLAATARRLKDAGLDRITVSLDTLQAERMAAFARSPRHADVVAGIDAAITAGFGDLKLNTVVVRGYNDDEIVAIAEFARERGIEPRYIEYMDVGGATRWTGAAVVPRGEIIAALEQRYGRAEAVPRLNDPHAPAARFRFAGGFVAGVISSTTAPFCRDCDRARLTADGTMFLCLYAEHGIDLREPMRQGATDADLTGLVTAAWRQRSDRGAEARLAIGDRGVLVPLEGLRADPRREMHVRGG
jgi:cyclic pyranopterin phosphate synthase